MTHAEAIQNGHVFTKRALWSLTFTMMSNFMLINPLIRVMIRVRGLSLATKKQK
jgi:hypothetical protein